MTLEPPHSADAERAVIGGAVVSPSLTADLLRSVQSGDFYDPGHAKLFAAIENRHRAGDPVDGTVVAEDAGITDARQVVADCITRHGSAAATMTHARTVADLAVVRRIQSIASTALTRIEEIRDPATLLDALETDLAGIDLPNDPRPIEGLWTAADLLDAEFTEPPWVAPGLLRETWRLLFVGTEGGGKSTMLRQVVAAVAAGQHPFTFEPIPPAPGLIVDVENPESVIRDGLKRMPDSVRTAELSILARPGGIDVRRRRDRDLLHRVFADCEPKIACIGPLYKLYRTDRGESDEQAAVACQQVLDELRVAHGCAMVLETHAPKGSGPIRELIPFGSSAWLRWPELGWKLLPCDHTGEVKKGGESVKIDRFRGDRVQVDVPQWFDRSEGWPWSPYWGRNGVPKASAA